MLALRIISKLPFPILWIFSDILYFLTYKVFRYRIDIVRSNITNSFPQKSHKEIRNIESDFYKNLSDYIIESLKCLTISSRSINSRVKFNEDQLREINSHHSVIILCSHLFNWEFYGVALNNHCNEYFESLYSYQKIKTTFADNLMKNIRSRFGAQGVERHLLANNIRSDKRTMFYILGDQTPVGQAKKYWTTFLNQKTAFYYGLGQISVLSDLPVYFLSPRKTGRGTYKIDFEKLSTAKGSKGVLDNYIDHLEDGINARPGQWLWSHRRWKAESRKRDILSDKLKDGI